MLTSISKAGSGTVVLLLGAVLQMFGIEYSSEQLEIAINGFMAFVGFALLVWGQLDRKDLKFGLFRK
jgi:uncharacterized membrane protein